MSASIIESIWPNSASSPHAKLLPLRRFIQEILRRSRTSFCTLQLALLYIVRLRSRLPPHSSRPPSTPTATLCGRRMFLSALIVAAKYLQDRNYSNRAWAKISSLPLCDVNTNEMEFLKLVDFELFVSHRTFASWSTMLMAR
ncbi:cyclin-domain-containing protein, partial [Zopfochytrium polystomum]